MNWSPFQENPKSHLRVLFLKRFKQDIELLKQNLKLVQRAIHPVHLTRLNKRDALEHAVYANVLYCLSKSEARSSYHTSYFLHCVWLVWLAADLLPPHCHVHGLFVDYPILLTGASAFLQIGKPVLLTYAVILFRLPGILR